MISPTLEEMHEFVGGTHVRCDKLICSLRDKTFYVTHYRCLNFIWRRGCNSCTRTESRLSLSARSCGRLSNTATCSVRTPKPNSSPACTNCCRTVFFREDLRKSAKARQRETDDGSEKPIKAAGKATFKRSTIINSDLVLMESTRLRILMNRPLAIGFTILELSKLVMYSAYYEQLLPRYGDYLRLRFPDTDSFIF